MDIAEIVEFNVGVIADISFVTIICVSDLPYGEFEVKFSS